MNISPVNNSQNFKGLWGITNTACEGNEYTIIRSVTKYYHPFKDETLAEINKAKSLNQNSYTVKPYQTDGTYIDDSITVQIAKPLKFTKQEFENYKNSRLGAKMPEQVTNPIEKELIANGLHDYLNNSKVYIDELIKRNSFSYKLKEIFKNIKLKLRGKLKG